MDNVGHVLVRQHLEMDNLIDLPDDASASIVSEFKRFWEVEDEFRTRGFIMKRGFLLWGPPGSGKTSCVNTLTKTLISEHDGIVIFIDRPDFAGKCLQMTRRIEPLRPIICVIEDIDALIERYGENEFLALLDGEAQIDNVIFVATTNYPERLDKRFVDRPSRFDTIKFIGMPSAESRRMYLKTKEPGLDDQALDEWVRLSEGFSIAHLKELVIAVKCFDQTLHEAVSRLEEMQSRQPTSSDAPDKKVVGFGRAA